MGKCILHTVSLEENDQCEVDKKVPCPSAGVDVSSKNEIVFGGGLGQAFCANCYQQSMGLTPWCALGACLGSSVSAKAHCSQNRIDGIILGYHMCVWERLYFALNASQPDLTNKYLGMINCWEQATGFNPEKPEDWLDTKPCTNNTSPPVWFRDKEDPTWWTLTFLLMLYASNVANGDWIESDLFECAAAKPAFYETELW